MSPGPAPSYSYHDGENSSDRGSSTGSSSPTATAYNLNLYIEPEVIDGIETTIPESRVLIIMTGGTICMRQSENGYVPASGFLDSCLRPRPSFNDGSRTKQVPVAVNEDGAIEMVNTLRTPLSKYSRRIRYANLEFDPLLDSSSINANGWGKIAKAIERNYQLFDSFVILHGTDSLAYTSSALSFMISNLGKPVILTGSQAPMTELHNDATDNLLGSLIIAGHYMIPEVCLFFNHRLFRGNRSTKTNAHDFTAFSSPNHPPLAKVGISTTVNWSVVQRPSRISPFRIQTDLASHVACLRIFPGILPEMVRGVLRLPGLRGLILETFGAGNAPEDAELMEVLREGIVRGVVVVSVTQCQVGSVSPLYAPATKLAKAGVVFGLDMTSEAALTKLSCLLANPQLSVSDVRKQMSRSLRGELTEQSETHFSHPSDIGVSPMLTSLTALEQAVQEQNLPAIQGILKESNQFLLNRFDCSGNTPLHLASTCSNIEILRDFLSQGASVHLRNKDGHTPLFLAANAGRLENVQLLVASGAHLHADEREDAKRGLVVTMEDAQKGEATKSWQVAGAGEGF